MKMKLLIGALVAFGAIQLIPVERTNPEVIAEPQWDSPQTREVFLRACGDCHSHETIWPWYSRVAPVSWLVAFDVHEGREHFNVSAWGDQKKNHGDEAAEEFREGHMPPFFYLPAHPEAQLEGEERERFLAGLIKTFGDETHDEHHEE